MENTGNASAAGQGYRDFAPTSERVEAIRQSTYLALSKAAPQSLCHYPFASELVTVCVHLWTHTHTQSTVRQTCMCMWGYTVFQNEMVKTIFTFCLFVYFLQTIHFSAKQCKYYDFRDLVWRQEAVPEGLPELWVLQPAGQTEANEHLLLNLWKGLSGPSMSSKIKIFNQNWRFWFAAVCATQAPVSEAFFPSLLVLRRSSCRHSFFFLTISPRWVFAKQKKKNI